jgi:hypothetical protein
LPVGFSGGVEAAPSEAFESGGDAALLGGSDAGCIDVEGLAGDLADEVSQAERSSRLILIGNTPGLFFAPGLTEKTSRSPSSASSKGGASNVPSTTRRQKSGSLHRSGAIVLDSSQARTSPDTKAARNSA